MKKFIIKTNKVYEKFQDIMFFAFILPLLVIVTILDRVLLSGKPWITLTVCVLIIAWRMTYGFLTGFKTDDE